MNSQLKISASDMATSLLALADESLAAGIVALTAGDFREARFCADVATVAIGMADEYLDGKRGVK